MQPSNSLQSLLVGGSHMVKKPCLLARHPRLISWMLLSLLLKREPTITTNLSLNDSDSNFFQWIKNNDTRFVELNNELQNIDWSAIITLSDLKKISWHLNPPDRRNLGKAYLQHEELHTIIYECEALLNSRPLTYLSENPSDLVPIAPSLFFQDQTEFCVDALDKNDLQNLRKLSRHLHAVKHKLKTTVPKGIYLNFKTNEQ
ncbi:integrase catalytic domain-containing protein [Trichonephila inaurata madagascariensis]|uniref:Integrase catalytic domain-containing protein n=1 Tax=Trichonephila inaurata madagascariensis TaxID=2747483 RepID=A0A8X6MJP6_9ARAC|nr:integrase catalytic domain-containing protein [Trichonephila inaurata madagascariensis]